MCLHRRHDPPPALEAAPGRLELLGIAGIDQQLRPLGEEAPGHVESDAAARPRDDDSIDALGHRVYSPFTSRCSGELQNIKMACFDGLDNQWLYTRPAVTFDQLVAFLAVAHEGRFSAASDTLRSEERRVGKECRSRWSPYH